MSKYKNLTDAQIQAISAKYFSVREAKSKAQEKPTIFFIGAQPGAGKSAVAQMVRRELIKQGGDIHVDADRMRERIPIQDYKPTSQETQADAGKLANALRTLAFEGRRNVIEEGTLRGPGIMAHVAEMAHNQGYRAELVAVATHREESLLGIYERFEKQHLNPALNPRFVPEAYHEGALTGFTENFAKDSGAFDRVRVVNRNGQTLFDSATRKNHYISPYEALQKGRELTPERLYALAQGWERVKALAEARDAPREHLKQIGKHMGDVAELGKAQAHMDGNDLEITREKSVDRERADQGAMMNSIHNAEGTIMQQWTQDEAIAYECAREAITHMRAILTSQITEESRKEHPDAEKLESLHAESSRLFRERAGLRVKDHAEIARVRAEYGAKIRAWNAENITQRDART